eukprot:a841554_96.p1 GENE.a841554_96~~a841554_96.p1  ORF type:complete len:473 (+),score=157.26 a841554_96:185-1420(+)
MLVYVVAFFIPVALARELSLISWPVLRKFCLMGFMDALCTLVVILAAPYVPGPLQIIYMQGVLPGTLAASIFFLKKRYLWSHYLGATIILAGITLSALDSHEDGSTPSRRPWLWSLLFLSFNVPASISSVYKEHVFRTAQPTDGVSVNTMNFWVSFCQFFWGLCFAPIVVPLLGLSWHSLPGTFSQGAACLFAHQKQDVTSTCTGYTTAVTALTFTFNIGWNFFILLLIKHASATMMFLSNTATIPLASLGFAIPFVVSGGVTPRANVTWEIVVSLVVVIGGLVIYQWSHEPAVDEQPAPEQKPLLINEAFAADSIFGPKPPRTAAPIAIGGGNTVNSAAFAGSVGDDGLRRSASSYIGSPMLGGGFRFNPGTSASRQSGAPGTSVGRNVPVPPGTSAQRSINGPSKYRPQ